MSFDKQYANQHLKRFEKTLVFMHRYVQPRSNILDLGPENPFTAMMVKAGFEVENTELGVDLDLEYEVVKEARFDVVTAFEIFEHMVAPFNLLKEIKADKLFASVPLKLWFADAYWNDQDPWDCHYHEFEPKQFQYLLNKAGWKIIAEEKWVTPAIKFGIRPLLRSFTPRHYMVYCERR